MLQSETPIQRMLRMNSIEVNPSTAKALEEFLGKLVDMSKNQEYKESLNDMRQVLAIYIGEPTPRREKAAQKMFDKFYDMGVKAIEDYRRGMGEE